MKKSTKQTAGLLTAIAIGIAGIQLPAHAESSTVTCAMLQNVIYTANEGERITLSDGAPCNENILIPKGRVIYLDAGTTGIAGAAGSNSIIVEQGSTLYLSGVVTGSDSDKATIANFGTLRIVDAPDRSTSEITSNNAGIAIYNFGDLSVATSGVEVYGSIKTDQGATTKIAGGLYNNLDSLTDKITKGCNVLSDSAVGERGYFSEVQCPAVSVSFNHSLAVGVPLETMPIGYTYTATYNYPEIADAKGYSISSSAPDIISVSGSALEGFNITAKAPGDATMSSGNYTSGMTGHIKAYDVTLDGKSILPNPTIYSQLIGQDIWDLFDGDDYSLAAKFGIAKLPAYDASDDEPMLTSLGDGKVLGYYEINCFVADSQDNWLASVTDLNGDAAKISLDLPNDLPSLADGHTRQFYVVRKHQDASTGEYQYDVLPAESDNSQLTFYSDKFSLFAVAYRDVEVTPAASEEDAAASTSTSDSATSPDTGSFTSGSQNYSALAIIGSLTTGLLSSALLFPRVKKLINRNK